MMNQLDKVLVALVTVGVVATVPVHIGALVAVVMVYVLIRG